MRGASTTHIFAREEQFAIELLTFFQNLKPKQQEQQLKIKKPLLRMALEMNTMNIQQCEKEVKKYLQKN